MIKKTLDYLHEYKFVICFSITLCVVLLTIVFFIFKYSLPMNKLLTVEQYTESFFNENSSSRSDKLNANISFDHQKKELVLKNIPINSANRIYQEQADFEKTCNNNSCEIVIKLKGDIQ